MFKNHPRLHTIILICCAFLCVATLQADPNKNQGKSGKGNSEHGADKSDFKVDLDVGLAVLVGAGISRTDARKLATRHGVTGGKPLPPGIRKNLARGKPIPPGIQKTRMPGSFTDALPHHEGYEWRQTGTDLVLVVSGSLVISDILEGVFD